MNTIFTYETLMGQYILGVKLGVSGYCLAFRPTSLGHHELGIGNVTMFRDPLPVAGRVFMRNARRLRYGIAEPEDFTDLHTPRMWEKEPI